MDREMKRHYTLLVDFLGKILGPDYEVALHELLDDSNEIIAIANGELTGRHLGSPLSNKMLEFLTSRLYETQDYVLRFESTSVTGKKLCSNSLFIKDPHGRLVGLLCINFDSSRYRELSARVMDLCGSLLTPGAPSGTHLIVENDELAIGGEVEVEFDAVAGFHSAAEGGEAIFRDAILRHTPEGMIIHHIDSAAGHLNMNTGTGIASDLRLQILRILARRHIFRRMRFVFHIDSPGGLLSRERTDLLSGCRTHISGG